MAVVYLLNTLAVAKIGKTEDLVQIKRLHILYFVYLSSYQIHTRKYKQDDEAKEIRVCVLCIRSEISQNCVIINLSYINFMAFGGACKDSV